MEWFEGVAPSRTIIALSNFGVVPNLSLGPECTVELSGIKLGMLPPLVLGGIIENQNSDFVMT